MSPPKDIPGFYYDSEKNRYFPIKGPIPGSNKRPKLNPCSSSSSSNKEVEVHAIKEKRIEASKLINLREIQGRGIFSNSKRCFFRDQYEKLQASQPVVWEYEPHRILTHNTALELVYNTKQSLNGSKDAVYLATGESNGTIDVFEICNLLEDSQNENDDDRYIDILSKPIWPVLGQNEASNLRLKKFKLNLCLPSEISCIKSAPKMTQKHALVTTLGSGAINGAYILDLDWFRWHMMNTLPFQCIADFDSTIWTGDFNPDGTHVVLGTSKGSTLLNIETKSSTWIYRGKSDVLSQQFACSGNVVLCGLRNGLVRVIDPRENRRNRSDRRNFTRKNKINKEQSSSNSVQMPSAVCSLVSLVSDENYFIGSSMNGSINLFDLRALKNGAVQSYNGHVNSYTRVQLAVNPSETMFLSGGQDCRVRIWSIKSGELLFAEKFSDSIFTSACWPDLQDRFNLDHSWGAWLGSRSGLFYMHGI